jgi:hypothetical protein
MDRILDRLPTTLSGLAVRAFAFLLLSSAPLHAQEGWWGWQWAADGQQPYSLALSGGYGTELYISRVFTSPWNARDAGDRVVYASGAREIGRLGRGALGFSVEAAYGRHFGRDDFSEYALSLVSRWHDFPWNDVIVTAVGFGFGPSYATKIPPIERTKGITTKILNQADIEFAFAPPASPRNQLFFRVEHRSGMFGLIDGAGDGSNFLTIGYRRHF